MPKVTVNNVSDFYDFLSAISRLGDVAEFQITPEGTKVNLQNSDLQMRFFLETKSLTGETSTFAMKEIQKFIKAIHTISTQFKDVKEIPLNLTASYIESKENVTFRLLTIKRECIEQYLTVPITSKLESTFSFVITAGLIKKLESLTAIGGEESKLYFFLKDGKVVGEINDRKATLANSISIPISAKYDGVCSDVICIRIENFRLFNLLSSPETIITLTDRGVLRVSNFGVGNNPVNKVEIISSLLKG